MVSNSNTGESNSKNKFNITTNALAESLQRSAATLKTTGNDINEAIALTVAGNSILQDPLSVGSGLKTISLRIQGKIIALTCSNTLALTQMPVSNYIG